MRGGPCSTWHLPGVKFLNDDSRQLLGPVLERLAEPAALWLDAHWRAEGTFGPTAECPLPSEHHSRFCPTCSSRLEDSRCKLVCRTFGYFLSCADFY